MIAACLCFKDSAHYLDEWLRFHFVQGFRRFYLYDNESSDGWRETVAPWVDAGLVQAKSYPGRGVQSEMYDDCLNRARGEVQWLAFIDDDEFLFPSGDVTLAQALEPFGATAGVAVNWMLYGSSGIEKAEPGWVIERFTRRLVNPDPHVKCIVQPERIARSRIIGHVFDPLPGYDVVDENFRPLRDPLSATPSVSRLRINHYLMKSWEEWRARRTRPQADTGAPTPHPESDWRKWDAAWSTTEDRSALRFIDAAKSCIPTLA